MRRRHGEVWRHHTLRFDHLMLSRGWNVHCSTSRVRRLVQLLWDDIPLQEFVELRSVETMPMTGATSRAHVVRDQRHHVKWDKLSLVQRVIPR